MRKNRFNDARMIAILRKQEAGSATAEVCRRHGVREPTFGGWKAKHGRMQVADARKLKTLEEENRRLTVETRADRGTAPPTLSASTSARNSAV